jgi:uncharacterized protein (TIGR00730 family)
MERGIAVFGSSEPLPGEPPYEQARELGRLLAEAGHMVVTGAYGGVMEAASRGAREAGGLTHGVACEIFSARRSANDYLTSVSSTPDLHLRQRELVDRSRGFVVLQGKAGTLSELALLWALHRGGCLAGRPVILLGVAYKDLLLYLERNRILEAPQLEICHVATTPAEAVEALVSRLKAAEECG